jgi:hypothetical protein
MKLRIISLLLLSLQLLSIEIIAPKKASAKENI